VLVHAACGSRWAGLLCAARGHRSVGWGAQLMWGSSSSSVSAASPCSWKA
jgi:hypothetical protein